MLLLALLYLGVHTMPRAWDKLNTDFPNYYLAARIAHEGSDTARINEWVWLQREKDHRALDARIIGLFPITPFSTLVMWPLTGLAPLTAKHVWLLVNLALLVPLCWLLRAMTGLPYRRIALVFALSFPLHRNLLYGQFYLLLLLLVVAGCWAYLREYLCPGRCLGSDRRGGKDLSRTVLYLFSAAPGLACFGSRSSYRVGLPRRLCGRVRLEPAPNLPARGSTLDAARRGPAAVCGGERFDLQRAALFISGRAAMESATVAQLSAVLRAAATYATNAGAGAGHPADPQARPHSEANPAGVVGAPGSVGGHLHYTGVV